MDIDNIQFEENGVKLTDEELEKVTGGNVNLEFDSKKIAAASYSCKKGITALAN